MDDNEFNKFFIGEALLANGFIRPLIALTHSEQVFNYFDSLEENQSLGPDFLLLDYRLPDCSGLEILEWIRSRPRFQTLPAIILSSSELPPHMREVEMAGPLLFLTKSVQLETLYLFWKLFCKS